MRLRPRILLALLVLLAAGLRLAVTAFGTTAGLGGAVRNDEDARDYHNLAVQLATRGRYAFGPTYGWGREGTAWRPPGYPVFLAAIYRLAGPSFAAARLTNVALGALSVLLLFAAARGALGRTSAFWAAGLLAFDPYLVHLSSRVLSETLFVFQVALAFALMVRAQRGSAAALAAAALVWSWAALTRPAVFPVLAALPFWLWASSRGRLGPGALLGRAVLVLVVGGLPIGLWAARNARVLGAPVPFSTNGGETFLGANNGRVLAEPASHGYWVSTKTLPGVVGHAPSLADGEVAHDRWKWNEGWRFLREHPRDVPVLLWRKALRYWNPVLRSDGPERLASILGYGLLLPFIAWGALRSLLPAVREGGLLLAAHLLVATNFAAALVFWGAPRFRVGTAPAMALFATLGILSLWETFRRHRARSRT
jgi:4-amino-4-deoxy-L-arabinose transferase-like glycosyltransferase